jgi:outer membrane protein
VLAIVRKKLLLINLLAVLAIILVGGSRYAAAKEVVELPENGIITLEQAIQIALIHNRSLQNSGLGVASSDLSLKTQKAEFDIKIKPLGAASFNSGIDNFWQAGATVSRKVSSGATISVTPLLEETGGSSSKEVDVALSLPLLQGAGSEFAMSGVYGSTFAYESAKLSFIKQQTETVVQTVTAVYNSIQTQQQVAFLQKQLDDLKEHLALAKIKERTGIINAMDLYRAEIRIQNVQEQLTSTNEQYANNIDQVKELLAIPQNQAIVVAAPVDYTPVHIDLEEALQIALKNRIELELSSMQIKESERQVAIARNNLLPRIDLRLGYNAVREEDFDELSDERWTAVFTSDTDLFRTSERNEYEQSKISFRQVQLENQGEEERVVQDVRFRLNTLEKQEERIRIRQEQAKQAMGKLRLAESKFRYGMANNFDLLEAQTELQQAKTDQMLETIGYIIGTYRLRSSLGTLIDRKNEVKPN